MTKSSVTDELPKRCLVKGCLNHSDAGIMVGDLCFPCHDMLVSGVVHDANPTFIGDLHRHVKRKRRLSISVSVSKL